MYHEEGSTEKRSIWTMCCNLHGHFQQSPNSTARRLGSPCWRAQLASTISQTERKSVWQNAAFISYRQETTLATVKPLITFSYDYFVTTWNRRLFIFLCLDVCFVSNAFMWNDVITFFLALLKKDHSSLVHVLPSLTETDVAMETATVKLTMLLATLLPAAGYAKRICVKPIQPIGIK